MLELSKQAKEELLQKKESALSFILHVNAILGLTTDPQEKLEGTGKSLPYKEKDTFQSKFLAILREQDRFLHINEIAKIANEYEPSYSLLEIKSKMGSAKNNLISKGSIMKYALETNSNLNTFYGFQDWITDGIPTTEHKYNEDYVSN